VLRFRLDVCVRAQMGKELQAAKAAAEQQSVVAAEAEAKVCILLCSVIVVARVRSVSAFTTLSGLAALDP
jgi:hypothetical protein